MAVCTYLMTILRDDPYYWCMLVGSFAILYDFVYVCVRRKGEEYTWFSISSLAYVCVMMVAIWILVIEVKSI